MSKKLQQLLLVFVIGAVIWFLPIPNGVKPEAWHLFAIFVATIVGFILHPLPIGAIALMAASLSGFLKILKPAEALKGYGDATIWLIVSAYLFALGFVKTGLGKRIAYNIMAAIGDSSLKLGYAMALSDLVVSPATPSNTARAGGILFPIVKSLAVAFKSEPGETARKIGGYLMKSTFQVNCVTSSMFITAVAPNALAVSLAAKATGMEISWGQWAMACIVPGLICVAMVPYLVYKLYPPEITHTPEAKDIAHKELVAMGKMSKSEKIVLFVFILSLLLWATAKFTGLNATMVAMVGVSIMLLGGAIEWDDVISQKGAWDTLVWMGTLMALASGLNKLGLIKWFANLVAGYLTGFSWMAALGILIVIYMWSHYAFASLSAHVAAMFQAFVAVAVGAGAPPFLAIMSLACLTGLQGCLTHYATGPAPIYFGAGYVNQNDWWKIGFIISLITVPVFIFIGGTWWKILGYW